MSLPRLGSAQGKIILSGEYAGIFGHRAIAMPSKESVRVLWMGDENTLNIKTENIELDTPMMQQYVRHIVKRTGELLGGDDVTGTMTVTSDLPIGKGMGSSTALVIAIVRCIVGDREDIARAIEDEVNPGHSGLDFSVIWKGEPIIFQKGLDPLPFTVPHHWIEHRELLDTGKPNETTTELIAWVKSRKEILEVPLQQIGECTERLIQGEELATVMRDHHKAQVALGVVPEDVQRKIADIEAMGGSAKVIGAGGRTGGGGMLFVLR